MNPVTSWLFSLMVAFAPPEDRARGPQFPGHEETQEQKEARYQSIADDLYAVVYDPNETPLFKGQKGRARTAALMLAIAYHESGFAHDVDVGPCYRGKGGQSARCDHGRSACLMQIHIGDKTTSQGYTQEELFTDRKKCFRAGLGLIRRSLSECRHLDTKHRLNAYASGVCTQGDEGSERLMSLMDKFVAKRALPADDAVQVAKDPKPEKETTKEASKDPVKEASKEKKEPKKDPPRRRPGPAKKAD